jgi:hypothetical protein
VPKGIGEGSEVLTTDEEKKRQTAEREENELRQE